MTQRWRITVEYDGTPFVGWQRQENDPSVQETIEKAILGFSGETVTLQVAGRTDAGVHATGQTAHFDLEKPSDSKTVRDAINAHMGTRSIAIITAEPVDQEFHARYSAKKRIYCYKITDSRIARPVIDDGRCWALRDTLDLDAMRQGAKHLLGQHDFSSFRASECQAESPIRTLDRLDIIEITDGFSPAGRRIEIWTEARSFLHHQVRNFVGTLRLVGDGKWQPEDIKTALEAKDRTKAGPSAPAHGLYLARVVY